MVQDLFLSQRHRDAMAAVPFDFIGSTSLLGDRDRIADGFQVLAASGVTTCALVPYGGSVEEKLNASPSPPRRWNAQESASTDHSNAQLGGSGLNTSVMSKTTTSAANAHR